MNNPIEITDLNKSELAIYAQLSEVQLLRYHEPKPGLFIAESPKVIERALDAGYEPVSFLLETGSINDHTGKILERCCDVPVYAATAEILKGLTGYQLTRGLLCAMKRTKLPTISEVCKNAHRIAVLEDVMNPTNVGAIFRSAAALNMDAILLTAGCSNPLYRRASRVSMGTVFQIPWTYICPDIPKKSPDNLVFKKTGTKPPTWEKDGIKQLHNLGFKTVAMALTDDSISIDHPDLQKEEKLAIILGTEGDGLANTTIAGCDYTVKIPMSHGVDSLNVAAASAVAFWELGIKKF